MGKSDGKQTKKRAHKAKATDGESKSDFGRFISQAASRRVRKSIPRVDGSKSLCAKVYPYSRVDRSYISVLFLIFLLCCTNSMRLACLSEKSSIIVWLNQQMTYRKIDRFRLGTTLSFTRTLQLHCKQSCYESGQS